MGHLALRGARGRTTPLRNVVAVLLKRYLITVGIISRDHVPGHLRVPLRRGDTCGGGVHPFYCTPLKYKRRAKRTSFAD